MSEVGKLFDSMLDYKIRQENAIGKKPEISKSVVKLEPSKVPEYYKNATWDQFIGGFTEREPISAISPDPFANTGLNFDVEVKTYGDGAEALSEGSLKYLEKVKENQGIYNWEVCCDELNNVDSNGMRSFDVIIPVQQIRLTCVIDRKGVTFSELADKLTKEDDYSSGVILEEYEEQSMDARVVEHGIAMDFRDDNNKSVREAFKFWLDEIAYDSASLEKNIEKLGDIDFD